MLKIVPQPFWREGGKIPGVRWQNPRSERSSCSLRSLSGLSAPTARAALEHVAVMQQTVEHGADGGDVA